MLPTLLTADHGAGFMLPSPDAPRAPPPQAASGACRISSAHSRARHRPKPGRAAGLPAGTLGRRLQGGRARAVRWRWVLCGSWLSGATVRPSRAHLGAAAGVSAAASQDPPPSSREPAALPPAGQAGAGEPRCALRGNLWTGRRAPRLSRGVLNSDGAGRGCERRKQLPQKSCA